MGMFDTTGYAAEDIIIKARLDLAVSSADLAGAKNAVKQIESDIKSLRGVSAKELAFEGVDKKEVMGNLRQNLRDAKVDVSNMGLAHGEMSAKMRKDVAGVSAAWEKAKPRFQGWALSFMLFGMQLKASLQSVWKQSEKTFNDVRHSVAGSVTGFDILSGSVKYLEYTLGSALEPLAYTLIPIIDAVSTWISENQELTATIFELGGKIAAFFIIVGGGTLIFSSLYDAMLKIGAINVAPTIATEGAEKALGTTGGTTGLFGKWNALKAALALGITAMIAYDLWGLGQKEATTSDWLKILGEGTALGFVVGGPWGAALGFTITAAIMVARETVVAALTTAERTKKKMEDILATGRKATGQDIMNIMEEQRKLEVARRSEQGVLKNLFIEPFVSAGETIGMIDGILQGMQGLPTVNKPIAPNQLSTSLGNISLGTMDAAQIAAMNNRSAETLSNGYGPDIKQPVYYISNYYEGTGSIMKGY